MFTIEKKDAQPSKILALVVVTALCLSLLSGCTSEKVTPPPAASSKVAQAKSPTVEVFGKVLADEKLTLSFSENIKVDEVLAKEGKLLNKNEKLITLDLKLLQAKKKVQQQLLQVNQVATVDNALLLSKAQSQLTFSKQALAQASSIYKKQTDLVAAGALPQEELDRALLNLQRCESEVAINELEVHRIAKENEKKVLEQTRQFSEIQKEEVQLESILSNSQDVKNGAIVSRFEKGVISKMTVSSGKFVPAGETIFELLNLNSRYILAEVPEEFISKVRVGMPAEITPTAQKDKMYQGKVTSIWNTSIEKNGETLIPVRIELSNYDSLLPNYNVDIRFLIQ